MRRTPDERVRMGQGSYICKNRVHLVGDGCVFIGNYSVIGVNVKIHTRDPEEPVVIGHGVQVGNHSVIGAGVRIGNGAVVLPYSVVEADVPAYGIVGGNPAELLRMRGTPDDIRDVDAAAWWNLGPSAMERALERLSISAGN